MKEPNYALFPLPRGVRVIMDYIDYGKDPGTFRPVVENDLITCMTSNPEEWLPCLQSLVLWLYTEAPAFCFGSPDRVADWQAYGGKRGRAEQRAKQIWATDILSKHMSEVPYFRRLNIQPEPSD